MLVSTRCDGCSRKLTPSEPVALGAYNYDVGVWQYCLACYKIRRRMLFRAGKLNKGSYFVLADATVRYLYWLLLVSPYQGPDPQQLTRYNRVTGEPCAAPQS